MGYGCREVHCGKKAVPEENICMVICVQLFLQRNKPRHKRTDDFYLCLGRRPCHRLDEGHCLPSSKAARSLLINQVPELEGIDGLRVRLTVLETRLTFVALLSRICLKESRKLQCHRPNPHPSPRQTVASNGSQGKALHDCIKL